MTPMLLVDAGNTRVKWALVDSDSRVAPWLAQGSVEHAQIDTLGAAWSGQKFARTLLSNVAGAAIAARLEQSLPSGVTATWFASTAHCAGLQNHYRNPAQLGCDRFASAIGAHALFPQRALIVATCGTATTVDAVTAEGIFIGGMILPGLGMMAAALAKNTAQLPQVAEDLSISQPFADHTDAAIVSGCLAAQAGAIERAVAVHGQSGPVTCLLSGGAAALIAPHLQLGAARLERIDNLVLTGLQTVATFDRPH
jgi:type III pantothenate kinase